MLERVEILEGGRKELRRGVGLVCDIVSDYWDDDVPFRLVDLSPSGAFVETTLPLGIGDELDVKFTPPRSRALYYLRARVVRTSFGRRCARFDVPGMGIEFLDLSAGDRAALGSHLVGIPPRVPMRSGGSGLRPNRSLISVGSDVVWVEELPAEGPQASHALEIDGVIVEALAPLLSAGRAAH